MYSNFLFFKGYPIDACLLLILPLVEAWLLCLDNGESACTKDPHISCTKMSLKLCGHPFAILPLCTPNNVAIGSPISNSVTCLIKCHFGQAGSFCPKRRLNMNLRFQKRAFYHQTFASKFSPVQLCFPKFHFSSFVLTLWHKNDGTCQQQNSKKNVREN